MIQKYILQIDTDKCSGCGCCVAKLPDFKEKHSGAIEISESSLDKEDVQESIKVLIRGCSSEAISLNKIE